MAATTETNIIVPRCALDALDEWRATAGLRRDPAVRHLFERYLELQQRRAPDERLTHISTLIWHPDMPVGRNQTVDQAARLRLRLPAGVADEARGVALRLPGQTDGVGGYHDYRPRLLADAFLTSLAEVIDFSDDVLDGLPAVLTQRRATGLFRLIVAASSTNAERRIYRKADEDLDRVHASTSPAAVLDPGTEHAIDVATMLREEDVAWHGPWRRAVAQHLVRKWLTGPEAGSILDAAERQDAVHFGTHRRLLEQDREHLRDELEELRPRFGDSEGRGGTAIWRVERLLEADRIPGWVAAARAPVPGRSLTTVEPGWTLTCPDSWRAATVRDRRTKQMAPHIALAAAGRVIHARFGGTHVFWPYAASPVDAGRLVPVSHIRDVLGVIGTRDPAEIIEILTAPEMCPGVDIGPIQVGAFVAHDLGFINRQERDELLDEARAMTTARMEDFIAVVPADQLALRRELTAAMTCPAEFTQIVAGAPYQRAVGEYRAERFVEIRARVPWPHPITSLAAEIERGLTGPALLWLTEYLVRRYDRVMTLSMDRAWRHALQGYRSTTAGIIDDL